MPSTLLHLGYFGILNISIVLIGYRLLKRKLLPASWVMFVSGILIVHLIFVGESPILRMLAIIATTFTGMKVIATIESYKGRDIGLNFKQWVIFAAGWAGMRPEPFETFGAKALHNAWPLIWFGISRIIIGGLLIGLAHLLVSLSWDNDVAYALVSIMLLIGFSLILHFGLLNISAGMWRLKGVNTYALFREPAKATSLTGLWAKRWNLAFSEMTSVAVFRPLKSKLGNGMSLMLSFAFSGLLHELALSVPVNSGYGLPLLYFIIQGILVLIEKYLLTHDCRFLQHKIISRVWTFFWLIVPMPLLFHKHFIEDILWPLAGLK